MTSSGRALVFLSLHTLLALPPDTTGLVAPVPRALARRVAERFAEAWDLPTSSVRLTWGRGTAARPLSDDAAFRVLGRGTGGWYAVVFDPTERSALALQVRVGVVESTCVAARALSRGDTLGERDLRVERRVRWGAPESRALAAAERPSAGWEVRRAVAEGEVLEWPSVAPPPMVVAGQTVRLEWVREGVRVALTGIALNDARRGETVRARVPERPARLTATVTAPGVAELPASGTGVSR